MQEISDFIVDFISVCIGWMGLTMMVHYSKCSLTIISREISRIWVIFVSDRYLLNWRAPTFSIVLTLFLLAASGDCSVAYLPREKFLFVWIIRGVGCNETRKSTRIKEERLQTVLNNLVFFTTHNVSNCVKTMAFCIKRYLKRDWSLESYVIRCI